MSRTTEPLALPTFLGEGAIDARPLVFLHGIGATAKGWDLQLKAFPNRRVLAWNACGYADSKPLSTAQPTVNDYAQALLALLDSLGIGPTALVASSWGTPIALALAELQPERVERLVLSGPTAGYGALPAAQRLALLAVRGNRARAAGMAEMLEEDTPRLLASPPTPRLLERLAQAREGVTLDAFLQALHALVHADAVNAIRNIACPTLIVYGEQDAIAPPADHARRLAAALPAARVHVMSQCGHLPHAEHPDSFNRLLGDFIDT